jgi:hypothetical protein
MANLNRLNAGRKLILELLTKHSDKIKHHIKQNPNDKKPEEKKKD